MTFCLKVKIIMEICWFFGFGFFLPLSVLITVSQNPRSHMKTSLLSIFDFQIFFLAWIHLEISYFHRLYLKRLIFAIKFMIYLPKLALNHCFLPVELTLLSKKPEAKSKYFSKWLFLEVFGKSLLLGVLTSIQCIQKWYRLDRHW